MKVQWAIVGGGLVISAFPFVLAMLLAVEARLRGRFGWTRRAGTVSLAHIGDFLWLLTVLAGLVINEALKQTYRAYEAQHFSTAHWQFLLLFIVVVGRFHLGILPFFRKVYVVDTDDAWKLFSFDFATRMGQYVLLFWASQGLKTGNVHELFVLLLLVMAANLTWYAGLPLMGARALAVTLAPWARSVAAVASGFVVAWLAADGLVRLLQPWLGGPDRLGELVGSLIYAVPLVIVVLARFWNLQGYLPADQPE